MADWNNPDPSAPGPNINWTTQEEIDANAQAIANHDWSAPIGVEPPDFEDYPVLARRGIARRLVEAEDVNHVVDGRIYYVRTAAHVEEMVTALASLPRDRPWMSFDLEASGLGHSSPLAFMQICDHLRHKIYLVDTFVLDNEARDTAGLDKKASDAAGEDIKITLRDIFGDEDRPKLAWDARQDSCCLYWQADISVEGVTDLQILHMLLMDGPSDLRPSIKRGVKHMAGLGDAYDDWLENKKGLDKKGYSWERRPLNKRQQKYSAGDVEHLYAMYVHAERWLTPRGMECGREFSKLEIADTWTTEEQWEEIKFAKIGSDRAGVRRDFKNYWDDVDANPIRRPGAASIKPFVRTGPSKGYYSEDGSSEEQGEEEEILRLVKDKKKKTMKGKIEKRQKKDQRDQKDRMTKTITKTKTKIKRDRR